MARQSRWVWYIGVYINNELHYVTSTNGSNAFWEAGKPAKAFSMRTAEDICEGLNLNMIHSVVIKAPSYMQIMNEEKAE